VRNNMNTELHTFLGYVQADIVVIRKRCASLSKIVFSCEKKALDTQESGLNKEFDQILEGIISTLDDMFACETMLWNSILLENLIQAFTSHLNSMEICHKNAQGLGSTSLSLDNNYIRIKCHADTILSILRCNIVSMCSSVSQKKGGESRATVPLFQRDIRPNKDTVGQVGLVRTTSLQLGRSQMSFVSSPTHHHSLGILSKSSSNPNIKKLIGSQSEKNIRTVEILPSTGKQSDAIRTSMYQHSKQRLKICSKVLVDEHDRSHHAILNSMMGEGRGVPVSYTDSTRQRPRASSNG
jgi:hypothetical protein